MANGQRSTNNNTKDTRVSKSDKATKANASGKSAVPQRATSSAPQPSKESGKRPAKG